MTLTVCVNEPLDLNLTSVERRLITRSVMLIPVASKYCHLIVQVLFLFDTLEMGPFSFKMRVMFLMISGIQKMFLQ